MVAKPTAVDVRAYNVGFGDCFLLVFEYGAKEKRCVLVDFGSTGRAKSTPATVMKDVAKDVSDFVTKHCGGVLHGVVLIAFEPADARTLAGLLTGRGDLELDDLGRSAIMEVGNILTSSYLNALAKVLGGAHLPSPPRFRSYGSEHRRRPCRAGLERAGGHRTRGRPWPRGTGHRGRPDSPGT